MRRVIAGNWKMNGQVAGVAAYAAALAGAPTYVEMVICPPFPLLAPLREALQGAAARLGAQDCHARGGGAHTGDVSAQLLKEIGCAYVILGHSERRADHGESNAEVAAKAEAALAAGLIPIVCVGESEAVRDAGEAEGFVRTQLAHSLPDDFDGLIAYEPIWAIGTGRTPSMADIAAMHAAIRAALAARFAGGAAMPILYGGSVKPDNAAALLAVPEVGGALVGGASLQAADLLAIAAAAPRD
jgi:triosephosphate isomerase